MLRPTGTLLLGSFAAAALCGCGGTELAAVEDPQAHAVAPAAPEPAATRTVAPEPAAAPLPSKSEVVAAAPAVPTPVAPEEPIGWDFFGPPVAAQEADEADPVAEHLFLRGFITMEGDPRKAVLWAGDGSGSGRILLLAAGESAGGVTVVELGEDTATVEHPGRVVLSLAPGRTGAGRVGPTTGRPSTGRPSIHRSSPPPSVRQAVPRPPRPDVEPTYRPPTPPPPPSADRLVQGHED
ncbi:hypothetical protein [Alienimonas sp. DA493]|uniref:hypothetical protein n=1 Tax=Alienimonas sp. DA493 TaxID=3373605 RepID=UPI0037551F65